MEEKSKAIIGCVLFFVIILVIGIGGYIYAFKNDDHKTTKELEEAAILENKKEEDKDFIYFENEKKVSETLGIIYKDAVINLDNNQATAINNEIKTENEELFNSVKKISETENDTGNEIKDDTDDIYSATIREYQTYKYGNYISLVISDSSYDCFKGVYDHTSIKSYIFDINTNERVSNIDILAKHNTSFSEVKNKIKEKIEEIPKDGEESNGIKIDETIENLANDNSYGLYLDESGDLIIKYIVKSDNLNYNENMIIN